MDKKQIEQKDYDFQTHSSNGATQIKNCVCGHSKEDHEKMKEELPPKLEDISLWGTFDFYLNCLNCGCRRFLENNFR